MKRILYITNLPTKYGGRADGGIANHSAQLILKAKEKFYVNIYSEIDKLIGMNNVDLVSSKRSKLYKLILALIGSCLISRNKKEKISFLSLRSRLKVYYHYYNLRNVSNAYDVIHIHSLYRLEITALSLIDQVPKIVVTDHGFWQGNLEENVNLLRYNSVFSNQIIYISDYSKEMLDKYNYNNGNLIKIENPMIFAEPNYKDTYKMKEQLNINDDKKVIFFSGVSEPIKRKGLDLLLQAVEISSLSEHLVVVIISNDEGLEYARRYKDKIDMRLLTPMTYEDVVNIYTMSDLFVMPSKSESFGLVYIESLSYGTPIIGFDKVVSEFKKNYKPLYIGEKYNPEKDDKTTLATKIDKVLTRDINKEALSNKTNFLYSWENKFKEFEAVYFQY